MLGVGVDPRALIVYLLDYKRTEVIHHLEQWIANGNKSFTIRDAATICGILADMSRYCRWGRSWFLNLRTALSKALMAQYHKVQGYYE